MMALDSYIRNIKDYTSYIDTKKSVDYAIDYGKKNRFKRLIHEIRPHYIFKLNILLNHNKNVPISFVIEIALLFAVVNFTKLSSNRNVFILFIVGSYIVIYYIVCRMTD